MKIKVFTTVLFIIFILTACPYGVDTTYSGVVARPSHGHEGTAVDLLHLPPNPQYLKTQLGNQGYARLEYEMPHQSCPRLQCSLYSLPGLWMYYVTR